MNVTIVFYVHYREKDRPVFITNALYSDSCSHRPFLLFPQRGTEGFWKPVADSVPREPSEMRILNPYFIQEAAFQFIGLPFNNGLMGKGVRPVRSFD